MSIDRSHLQNETLRVSERFTARGWFENPHPFGTIASADDAVSSGDEKRIVLKNEILRSDAVRTTVQLLMGERCALAAGAGLINAAWREPIKIYLASQVFDASIHAELLSEYLAELGVGPGDLEETIQRNANPDLLGLAESLLAPVLEGDFIVGVVGPNLILAEIMRASYELLASLNAAIDPRFSKLLQAMLRDEKRHLEFGEHLILSLAENHPETKVHIAAQATDISRQLLRACMELFGDNPASDELMRLRNERGGEFEARWQGVDLICEPAGSVRKLLLDEITSRIRQRLGRIGVNYHPPMTTAAA